ncbi:hypothetical protein [Curvivirga aplysinae]|uniref:hypothetical protein n=1 Tax=Curvivirga aplysinae TaxID=2529852 RepID=UPI0012BB9A81|nr:hypothetical protein [Curvivirga aplysinae]MTI09557.1 hypothetical protein [Curvivirga aplysinae]
MSDLSREELKAHLSAVEAQVRAALRIVAAESKSVQQAHSTLRADLSSALIRLQSDVGSKTDDVDAKVTELLAEVRNLQQQKKSMSNIMTMLLLIFGIFVGIMAGGSWAFLNILEDKTHYVEEVEAPSSMSMN